MGFDATNYIPKSVSKEKLYTLIDLLGFKKTGRDTYHFYKDDEYKYLYGVLLHVLKNDNGWSCHTRTPIYCSYYDLKYQNYVMKCLKQYLGGYFISDEGTNRYFSIEKNDKSSISERGCYIAYFHLFNQFQDIMYLVSTYEEEEEHLKVSWNDFGVATPSVLLSNISTTYLCSIIENYFRDLYVALLTDSDKKEKVLSNSRLNNNDLIGIAENYINIEQAAALTKSFQNIHKINSYFREIDSKIDIKGILSKPYHNRKENLFMTLDRILEHRHSLVHRLIVDISYYKNDIIKDIKSVETALNRVYKSICLIYNWEYVDQ